MCSRFLLLAATVAVVACGSNSAAASDDATSSKVTNFAELIAMAAPGMADFSVTENNGSFLLDSPYYKTTLEWDEGKVSFCDMHVSATGHPATDLPLMEGAFWSSPERKAGIYFMESVPGIGLHIIKCKEPENFARQEGTASIEWEDLYGYRNFRMKMDGGSVTIEGYDPETGQPVDNWFLSLITAREKGNDLPFTVIVPDKVNSEFNGREYHLTLSSGKAALNRDDTPPVFSIYPENGTITLTFDVR